ncbi:hypothetical protein GCM10025779_23340 [Arthrobacter cryoconiti]
MFGGLALDFQQRDGTDRQWVSFITHAHRKTHHGAGSHKALQPAVDGSAGDIKEPGQAGHRLTTVFAQCGNETAIQIIKALHVHNVRRDGVF